MSTPDAFAEYLAAWNARDPDAIRAHLERSVAPDAVFVDPANRVTGIDAIEGLIREAKAETPGATYARTTGIDGHNRRYRYRWEARFDETTVVPGMDVTTLNDAGLIERIDGFFGDFPPMD